MYNASAETLFDREKEAVKHWISRSMDDINDHYMTDYFKDEYSYKLTTIQIDNQMPAIYLELCTKRRDLN